MLDRWSLADEEMRPSPEEFAWGDDEGEDGWGGSLDWSDEDLDEDDLDEDDLDGEWEDEDEEDDDEEDEDEEWEEWEEEFDEEEEHSLGRRRSGRPEWN